MEQLSCSKFFIFLLFTCFFIIFQLQTLLRFNGYIAPTTQWVFMDNATAWKSPENFTTDRTNNMTVESTSTMPQDAIAAGYPTPFLLTASLFGGNAGLGNKIFAHAAAFGAARSLKMRIVLPQGEELVKTFRLAGKNSTKNHGLISVVPDNLYREMTAKWKHYGFGDWGRYGHIENLTGNAVLDGYFQSYKHFESNKAELRETLTFLDPVQTQASLFVSQALEKLGKIKNQTVLVGIHVRRGDFVLQRNIDIGYTVASKSYFLKAMDYFRSEANATGKDILFLIASNDVTWCAENLLQNSHNASDALVMSNEAQSTAAFDLAVLASCQHSIISTGSFSYWAGYLAGGKTIFYANYPRNGSEIWKGFNQRDYYPPHWIPML